MGPPSFNGGHPMTIRVKNVTRDSFAFQFQEWTYLDGPHTKESVSYMIVEDGVHQLSDGTFVEAGKVMVYKKWLKVDFEADFKRAPNVFTQITSQYKYKPYNTRQRYITDNGFQVVLQAEEKLRVTEAEEVSYVAWGVSKNLNSQWYSGRSKDNVDEKGQVLQIKNKQNVKNTPAFFAAMQTTDGGDTAGIRYKKLNGQSVSVYIQEEQSRDKEADHTTEVVGYLAIFGQDIKRTALKPNTIVEFGDISTDQSKRSIWHEVEIKGIFKDPVVVMGTPSYRGGHPMMIRVVNVTSNSFKWQMQEWTYLDNVHTRETISYMVVERGLNYLNDGSWIEAGVTKAGAKKINVKYSKEFPVSPVVISQITTQTRAANRYVTRVTATSKKGFQVFLQAEEKLKVTESEQVSWVAWSTNGKRTSQWQARATPNKVTNKLYKIDFVHGKPSKPAFFAAMQTADGMNTAGMRYKTLTGDATQVFIEEETSKDKERDHTTEVVGYIALWGDAIDYSDLGDGKIVKTDFSAMHRVERLPLKESSMYFKSIQWKVNVDTE